MEIRRITEPEKLKCTDLKEGDTFIFSRDDEKDIYLKADNDTAVSLKDGFTVCFSDYPDSYVQKVNGYFQVID